MALSPDIASPQGTSNLAPLKLTQSDTRAWMPDSVGADKVVSSEAMRTASSAWDILNNRENKEADVKVRLQKFRSEVLHPFSRNEVIIDAKKDNRGTHVKSRLRFLWSALEQDMTIEDMVNDLLKPNVIGPGNPLKETSRFFEEARGVEKLYKKASGDSKKQAFLEGIRYTIIMNALRARKEIPAMRSLIIASRIPGRSEELVRIAFFNHKLPQYMQGDRVHLPWTEDLEQAVLSNGGYDQPGRLMYQNRR